VFDFSTEHDIDYCLLPRPYKIEQTADLGTDLHLHPAIGLGYLVVVHLELFQQQALLKDLEAEGMG